MRVSRNSLAGLDSESALTDQARKRLEDLDAHTVRVHLGDWTKWIWLKRIQGTLSLQYPSIIFPRVLATEDSTVSSVVGFLRVTFFLFEVGLRFRKYCLLKTSIDIVPMERLHDLQMGLRLEI